MTLLIERDARTLVQLPEFVVDILRPGAEPVLEGYPFEKGDVVIFEDGREHLQGRFARTAPREGGIVVFVGETMLGVKYESIVRVRKAAFELHVPPAYLAYDLETPPGLTHLVVPVPFQLERAIGYEGKARFVAFYWLPGGDEVMFDDGRYSSTGEWDAYLAFIRHLAVAPALQGYHLGDSENDAMHWLVLDRHEPRTLYVAPTHVVSRFLQQQWPQVEPAPPVTMTQEEMMQAVLDALKLENWQQVPTPDSAQIMRRMHEHDEVMHDMQAFLDEFTESLEMHFRQWVVNDQDRGKPSVNGDQLEL